MLPEQRVDIERSADIAGRIGGADLDMRACVGCVYLLQIGAGRGIDLCAGDRIARDAAAEIMDAAGDLLLVALAEEVDERDDQPFAAFGQLLFADAGKQPDMADPHLDLSPPLAGPGDQHGRASLRERGW